jgi:hypothetical protein
MSCRPQAVTQRATWLHREPATTASCCSRQNGRFWFVGRRRGGVAPGLVGLPAGPIAIKHGPRLRTEQAQAALQPAPVVAAVGPPRLTSTQSARTTDARS